ncbi:MAG: ribA [Candidatus Nomurabacteria bacterium]|nr:ribA [Candidatus Nomurabacteria bacterium]
MWNILPNMAITAQTVIQTEFGPFNVSYHKIQNKELISFAQGDITFGSPIVRIQSACLFGEAFHSEHCDCAFQLTETMKAIHENQNGVIMYVPFEEGRGVGLENKIKSMELERTKGIDIIASFKELGFEPDPRNFNISVKALNDLNLSKEIKSFSSNPRKRKALEEEGYIIRQELEINPSQLSDLAKKEKQFKIDNLGYFDTN